MEVAVIGWGRSFGALAGCRLERCGTATEGNISEVTGKPRQMATSIIEINKGTDRGDDSVQGPA
jgi:hypothetical protein